MGASWPLVAIGLEGRSSFGGVTPASQRQPGTCMFQERLRKDNAAWLQATGLLGSTPVELRADGDSQLSDEQVR